MINAKVDEKDLQQLCAQAKNAELLQLKIKALQNTLNTYKEIYKQTSTEKDNLLLLNKKLKDNIKELQTDKDLYTEAVKVLSQKYKLPQNAINQVINYINNGLEREK
jgi:uncharacterized UPF0160 family protein